jgi:hypothetical protein
VALDEAVPQDRVRAADRGTLLMERRGAPMHVGVLALADTGPLVGPGGAIRLTDLRDRLYARAPAALRQALASDGGTPRRWRGGDWDAARHVRIRPLPARTSEAGLLDMCAALVLEPFAAGRPPWELVVLPGAPGGRVGLLIRLHHALADGIAALPLLLPLFDGPPTLGPLPHRAAPAGPAVVRLARARQAELATLLRAARTPAPPFVRPVGTRRRLVVVRADLAALRAAAHAASGHVDDLLLDAAAAGVRAQLGAAGALDAVPTLVVSVAATLRTADRGAGARNLVGVLPVPVPLQQADPARRLAAIVRADDRVRSAPALQPGGPLLQRWTARVAPTQHLVHLLLSNVPGPPAPLTLLGAPVRELLPIGLVQGDVPISVVGLSYAGRYAVGILADPDAVPDLRGFADAFAQRLAEVTAGPVRA